MADGLSWRAVRGFSDPFSQHIVIHQLSQDQVWSDPCPSYASTRRCGWLLPSESLAGARVSPGCYSRCTCAAPSPLSLAQTIAPLLHLPSRCSSCRWPHFDSHPMDACHQADVLGETSQAPAKTDHSAPAATSGALRPFRKYEGCHLPLESAPASPVNRSTCLSRSSPKLGFHLALWRWYHS